ncbi:MAG: cytidine deaminase [Clostridia bacterium]|nr:cytidine deaminase [Clostridia bacterium]
MRLSDKEYRELISAASSARGGSYSPYSHFAVGAALLSCDGRIFTGCNVENSSYSATLCAERVAIFHAVAQGYRDFTAIAVVGGPSGKATEGECQPCAVCLQVMAEFCDADFEIITENGEGGYNVYRFADLLAKPFKF